MRDGGHSIPRKTVLLACIALLVLVLPLVEAQESDELSDHGVLKGVVFNTHYDSPVPNAYVLVESDVGYMIARSTDEEGGYRFHLPYGTYSMRVLLGDHEMANATGLQVDPSPLVRDVYISFTIEEPVLLHGVIKLDGEKCKEKRMVFQGHESSYLNETVTGRDGSYSLHVPLGSTIIQVYESGELVGEKKVGPFITPGSHEKVVDIDRIGAPPTLGDWSDFVVTTWTGIALWVAIVFALMLAYIYIHRRVDRWLGEEQRRFSPTISEMLAYTVKGYGRVLFLFLSILALDAVVDIEHDAGRWINFWLWALVTVLALWVTGRLLMKLIDYMMIRLRQQRLREGLEVPETAFIFIHGILRYLVIAIFGFFILLILLSGAGLYDEIAGGFTGFIDLNLGYLVLLVLIVIIYLITNRFVRLTLNQMKQTSTRFSPQMIGIFGFIAKIAIAGIFSVLFIFTLLTMAGMQEMGALIMALLTTSVGLIVAVATTGAIGNALAGMVLMSLKPIEPGQLVEVADDKFGYVVDVTTFFTRLRTYRNEIIEIPNNIVLATDITNFSRRKNIGIEVTMGIGYDVPADRVLDLLKNGAKGTSRIVKDPKPQAMVTDFKDYAIQYLLRAFTDDVDRYFQTKSTLMQNLQELFYTEGIEIMTPWQIMRREEAPPCREDVIKRYAEHLKHKDSMDGDNEKLAAAMDLLDGKGEPEAK